MPSGQKPSGSEIFSGKLCADAKFQNPRDTSKASVDKATNVRLSVFISSSFCRANAGAATLQAYGPTLIEYEGPAATA
jgi:hypothetical protein